MGIRSYPSGNRIYLDMDGPMFDFDRYCREHHLTPEMAKNSAMTYIYLPVTAGFPEALEALTKMVGIRSIFVLTKIPSTNPAAASAKILSLNHHFPQLKDQIIIITPDKGCVGCKDDFLIDDNPMWANALKFRGTTIFFNTKHPEESWRHIIAGLSIRSDIIPVEYRTEEVSIMEDGSHVSQGQG